MGCGDSRSLKPEAAVSSLTKVVLTPEAEPLDISQSVQNRTVKSFQEHYKLVSLLGLGNFSKVFKACHLQSGQQRAVKIIEMPQLRACDSHRAWKEIGVLRSLDHAHIIKGYESFTDRGRYYSVLELCEGGQLVKKMLTVELSPTNQWVCGVMKQLLSAVSYCHKQQIIHRNIRPESILLASEEGWNIKLAGFVYAVKRPELFSNDDEPLQNQCAPPKSCFIAPQCQSIGYSEKSDVWACGMFLYLLLTGGTRSEDKENQPIVRQSSTRKSLRTPNFEDLESIPCEPARDLIKSMLDSIYKRRPNAEQCLEHRYFSKAPPITSISHENIKEVVKRLRNFHVESVMENFIMMYNCHHLATLKQKDSYQPEFEIIDANSDGFVTKDELLNALIRFGVDRASAEQQTNHLFETIDRNFNGVIDYSEYVMATLLSDRRVNESDLQSMFRLINTNNKVALDIKDITKVLDKKQTERFMKELSKMKGDTQCKSVDLERFKIIMQALLKSKGRLSLYDDNSVCE